MVNFRTNVDCCKRFMANISGLPLDAINPLIGDKVRVYHDSEFEIWMTVAERSWFLTNGTSPVLECYLSLGPHTTIPDFEKMLRQRGFRW